MGFYDTRPAEGFRSPDEISSGDFLCRVSSLSERILFLERENASLQKIINKCATPECKECGNNVISITRERDVYKKFIDILSSGLFDFVGVVIDYWDRGCIRKIGEYFGEDTPKEFLGPHGIQARWTDFCTRFESDVKKNN